MILRKQIRATKLSQPRATRQRWPKTNLAPRRNHARPFVYTAGGHGTEHPRLHKNANGCMIGKHKTHPPYYPSATNTESNGPMHYLVFLEAWSPLLSWATQCLPTIFFEAPGGRSARVGEVNGANTWEPRNPRKWPCDKISKTMFLVAC